VVGHVGEDLAEVAEAEVDRPSLDGFDRGHALALADHREDARSAQRELRLPDGSVRRHEPELGATRTGKRSVRGAVSAPADARNVKVPEAGLEESGGGLRRPLSASRREQALDGQRPMEGFENLVGIVGRCGPPTHVCEDRLGSADRQGGRVWE
jgi:hypothetical protein